METSAGANPFGALLGFWMLVQLVVVLGLLLGGLYALFCLHRAASNLERLASSVEEFVALSTQNSLQANFGSRPDFNAPFPVDISQSTLGAPTTQPYNSSGQTNPESTNETRFS